MVRFRVEPPGFFLDDLGAYLPEGVIDLSGETSPSAALAAGFGDDFKGVYLKEVSLFFPRDTPLVGSFLRSVGLRETLIGNAYAGEAVLELGPDLATTLPVPSFLQVLGNETRALTFDPDTSTVETVIVAESFARVIAVADVNTPWREQRGQARWVAPDGETYTGARTPPLQVRPGDTILYDYVAAEGFEPPPTPHHPRQRGGLTGRGRPPAGAARRPHLRRRHLPGGAAGMARRRDPARDRRSRRPGLQLAGQPRVRYPRRARGRRPPSRSSSPRWRSRTTSASGSAPTATTASSSWTSSEAATPSSSASAMPPTKSATRSR